VWSLIRLEIAQADQAKVVAIAKEIASKQASPVVFDEKVGGAVPVLCLFLLLFLFLAFRNLAHLDVCGDCTRLEPACTAAA
jgi:hypothetical protein